MKTEAETRLVCLHTEKCSPRGQGGHGAGPPAASPGANPADARGPADSRTERERLWSAAAGALFNGPSRLQHGPPYV